MDHRRTGASRPERRSEVLGLLDALPPSIIASDDEVRALIEREQLSGTGIGYIDAALLAAARLTPDTTIWTRDRRLEEVAARLGLTHQ